MYVSFIGLFCNHVALSIANRIARGLPYVNLRQVMRIMVAIHKVLAWFTTSESSGVGSASCNTSFAVSMRLSIPLSCSFGSASWASLLHNVCTCSVPGVCTRLAANQLAAMASKVTLGKYCIGRLHLTMSLNPRGLCHSWSP